jgi:hypothetical protein
VSEPIHIISLGAGVQSSTMALMAAAGDIKPMPKCAIFADTQDEPASVYKWLDWLEKQLPFPVSRVTAGSLADEVCRVITSKTSGRKYTRCSIPAFLDGETTQGKFKRGCTYEFKVAVINRELKQLTAGNQTVQWIGISADEKWRMKPSKLKFVENIWPLIERNISRRDCLKWMDANGFPVPPRSACVYCPFHSDAEWRRLKEKEPEEFDRAVKFEKRFQSAIGKTHVRKTPFLHRSMVPLSEVDFSTEEERGQLNMFNNECEGMCGV